MIDRQETFATIGGWLVADGYWLVLSFVGHHKFSTKSPRLLPGASWGTGFPSTEIREEPDLLNWTRWRKSTMATIHFDEQMTQQRSLLNWLIAATCLVECLVWLGCAFIMYWFVPTAVEQIRGGLLVELPRSMVHVIQWTDFAAGLGWLSALLLLAWIVVPKVLVLKHPYAGWVLFLLVIVGVCVPVAIAVWGTGLPMLIQHGLLPI